MSQINKIKQQETVSNGNLKFGLKIAPVKRGRIFAHQKKQSCLPADVDEYMVNKQDDSPQENQKQENLVQQKIYQTKVELRPSSAALDEQKRRKDEQIQKQNQDEQLDVISPHSKQKELFKLKKDSIKLNLIMISKQKKFRIIKSKQQQDQKPNSDPQPILNGFRNHQFENVDFIADIEEFQNSIQKQELYIFDSLKQFQQNQNNIELSEKQSNNQNEQQNHISQNQEEQQSKLLQQRRNRITSQKILKKTMVESDSTSDIKVQDTKQIDKTLMIQQSIDNNMTIMGEQIGEGAYGKVFRVFLPSGCFVAVKQIPLDQSKTQQVFSTIQTELALLKRLNHPNIVKYYGYKQSEKDISIYLEYMSGGSIADRLKQFGKFPEQLIKKFVIQVLQGLVYLHDQGIVHRDLKGGNILSDENGNVKLADFGASRLMDILPNKNLTHSEMSSSLKGSLFWMAPELLLQQPHGRRIDVWSLGCTIIEMATATHPWEPCNKFSDLINQVVTNKCPQLPTHLSIDCLDFIKQCCIYDKNLRPKSLQLVRHQWIFTQ